MKRQTIRQTLVRALAVAFFAVAVLSAPQAALAKQKLGPGLTGKGRAEVDKTFAGILAHLNGSPDFEFEVSTFPSYEASYAALKAKKVDLIVIGAVLYVEARHEIGVVPIVARREMPAATVEAVHTLFTSYKPVPGERFGKGATAAKDSDFNQLRFLCKVVLGKSYVWMVSGASRAQNGLA